MEYLEKMTFKEALEKTIELLKDKNITFDVRCNIADDFCSYYPYFDSSRFNKYFLDD